MRSSPFAMLAISFALAPTAAAGPTFTVNSLLDVPGGGSLTDGVCETATGNGICTLRAAVMEANHVAGGEATIVLSAATYFLTIPISSGNEEATGDLDVVAPMTIVGDAPSATVIDANGIDRVLDVAVAAGPVLVRRLTLTRGSTNLSRPGGCLRNDAELTLDATVFSNCQGAHGGAIYTAGNLTIRSSVVAGGSTLDAGGGVYNADGAILRIEDSRVAGNGAASGGGIANLGTATIERTSLLGNTSNTSGPSGFGGGAIFNSGSLVLENAILSGNTSLQHGGGLYSPSGSALLVHVTIADNWANRSDIGSTGLLGGGIGANSFSPSVVLRSSIVAANSSGSARAQSECAGQILSGDYNTIGVRSTCALLGSLAHVNAADVGNVLYPLLSRGGFAPDLFPLLPPSISLANCTDSFGAPLLTDARGYARRATGSCDIGAIEASGSFSLASPLGVELIRNGGTAGDELGIASVDTTRADPPYWSISDFGLSQVVYGSSGFPARGDAPSGSGSYFFAGGSESDSVNYQRVGVFGAAAAVDAGTLAYRLSGAFGGFATEDDNAVLRILFLDASAAVLGEASVGGLDASDRGNQTRLIRDSEIGVVPVGTRVIEVDLYMNYVTGAVNDAYADDLSLVLPEPSEALAISCAAATLACVAARSRSK